MSVTAGTGQVVWTPATGRKFRLIGWHLSPSTASTIIFRDGGASGTIAFRTGTIATAIGQSSPPGLVEAGGYLSSTAGNTLAIDVGTTAVVSGFVYGVEE